MLEPNDAPIEVMLNRNYDANSTTSEEESKKDVENCIFIKDHFSLNNPSSTIAFADKKTHIFTNGTDQLTLGIFGGSIEAKETSIATTALVLVRSAYTLVATLMAGFLLVFCIQLILFLFVTLLIGINKTPQPDSSFIVLGTILSIPTVAFGLTGAMNIAASFVSDTWHGHRFIKSVLSSNSVLTDWITFSVFFLIPVVVGTGFLYAENDRWWDFSSIAWFIGVFAYYLLFSVLVIYYELRGCYEMVQYNKENCEKYDNKESGQLAEFFNVIKDAILLRQLRALSGFITVSYIGDEHSTTIDYDDEVYDEVNDEKKEKKKDVDVSTDVDRAQQLGVLPSV